MNVGIDAVVERFEAGAMVARAEDAAFLDSNVEDIGMDRVEAQRADMRNVRRRGKAPAVASRHFQKGGTFAEGAAAVLAAENPRMRGTDEDFARGAGHSRDRPYFFVSRHPGRVVRPSAAAVARAGQ